MNNTFIKFQVNVNDRELTIIDILVHSSLLTKYEYHKGSFYTTQEYLHNELGISVRSIKDSIKKLEIKGYIKVDRKYDNTTKKTLNYYQVFELPAVENTGYALGEDVKSVSQPEVIKETLISEPQIVSNEEVIIKDDKVSQIKEKRPLTQSCDETLIPEPSYMTFSADDSLTEKDIEKLNHWYSDEGKTYPFAYICNQTGHSFLKEYHLSDFLTMLDSTYLVAAGETTDFKLREYFNLLLKNNNLGRK